MPTYKDNSKMLQDCLIAVLGAAEFYGLAAANKLIHVKCDLDRFLERIWVPTMTGYAKNLPADS